MKTLFFQTKLNIKIGSGFGDWDEDELICNELTDKIKNELPFDFKVVNFKRLSDCGFWWYNTNIIIIDHEMADAICYTKQIQAEDKMTEKEFNRWQNRLLGFSDSKGMSPLMAEAAFWNKIRKYISECKPQIANSIKSN